MRLIPTFKDYELIDSGDGEKLERFGCNILRRPEPQAVWHRTMSEEEWKAQADASFLRLKDSDERGEWNIRRGTKEQWWVRYSSDSGLDLSFRLGMTSFKHVGLFPEQASNWEFIYSCCRGRRSKVLNMFAYTGGASLAARKAGADVTHVDSVKQVVTWARENLERSGMDGVRWIVEDAVKFAEREVRRGNQYDGIILDPPAYGRGPQGEKWVLERDIAHMLDLCSRLLVKRDSFLVLSLYSMGLSPTVAQTAVRQAFGPEGEISSGELCFGDGYGKTLPLGTFLRLRR